MSETLLTVTYFDGFTERLLSYELSIDTDFNYQLLISSFDKVVSYSTKSFHLRLEGQLPDSLQAPLHSLQQTIATLDLPDSNKYKGLTISGLESTHYTFYTPNHRIKIEIMGEIDENIYTTKKANQFLTLHQAIDTWVNTIYKFQVENRF